MTNLTFNELPIATSQILEKVNRIEFLFTESILAKEKNTEDAILTSVETTKLLKISKTTLYKLMKEGMPYYKIGDALRFNKHQVLDFIKRYNTQDSMD